MVKQIVNKAIRHEVEPLNTFVLQTLITPLDNTLRSDIIKIFFMRLQKKTNTEKQKLKKNFLLRRNGVETVLKKPKKVGFEA